MSAHISNLRMKRLAACLCAALALSGIQTHALAQNIQTVTSCADDNATGTLRQVVANAASGDEIDMSGLSCVDSTITLSQGEITIPHNAQLLGPADHSLTITNNNGRVLHSTSMDAPYSYLDVVDLNISGGRVYADAGNASGGCILASGNLTLTGSTVSDCIVSASQGLALGGAVNAKSVSLQSSRISGSAAYAAAAYQFGHGGGVYASNLTCSDSILSGNLAVTTSGNGYGGQGGGAFIAGGSVDLSRCTIDSNLADSGGGIMQYEYAGSTAFTAIKNTTISGNTATYAFGGFDLDCRKCDPAPLQIFNSTVAFNSSSQYSAGIFTSGSVVAQSTIIANNQTTSISSSSDLFTNDLTGADNLIVSTNATPVAGVVTVTSDPRLAPLADHGGLTRTHALSLGSPAISMGNNSLDLPTDQRGVGFARVVNGAADIGAYERQVSEDEIGYRGFD